MMLHLLAFAFIATVSASPARVAKCGSGPAALQQWQLGAPQAGFLYNSASHQCLNVAGCATSIIYDSCATGDTKTCGGGEYSIPRLEGER